MESGKLLIYIGLAIVAVGIVWYLFGDKLGWIGNLPGDINYKGENSRVYFPITTMLLLSVLASLAMWLFRKFF